jgi:hypothetical protein
VNGNDSELPAAVDDGAVIVVPITELSVVSPGPTDVDVEPPGPTDVDVEPPGPTDVDVEPPGPTDVDVEPPGPTDVDVEPPAPTDVDVEPPGPTDVDVEPPGPTDVDVEPPGPTDVDVEPPGPTDVDVEDEPGSVVVVVVVGFNGGQSISTSSPAENTSSGPIVKVTVTVSERVMGPPMMTVPYAVFSTSRMTIEVADEISRSEFGCSESWLRATTDPWHTSPLLSAGTSTTAST